MNENYLKDKAEQYALEQYFSEVPEDMTYEQVIALLRDDTKDIPDDLIIWEPFEEEALRDLANIIECTKDSIFQLLKDVSTTIQKNYEGIQKL